MLFDAYAKAIIVNDALGVFLRMKFQGFEPSTRVCNILLDTIFKLGYRDLAWRIYKETLGSRIGSDVYTLSILIHGCGEEGKLDKAHRLLLADMQEFACKPMLPHILLLLMLCSRGECTGLEFASA